MSSKFFPQQFEKKWVEVWEKEGVYKVIKSIKSEKKKQYVLAMFPYPSAAGLHVGHVRIYTGTDVLARYLRMKGHAVLHPMGWDAFGLPAENSAIKEKKNPMDVVPQNITNFKRQMKMLGFSYDWEREFSTTDPQYYKWTQWLFIQFFKMGLLYKKNTAINFCPKCKSGLAEEEVLSDGTHERCGNKITKKELPQWIFRITVYADRLLEDLRSLPAGRQGLDWPKGILEMQRNWIGRKEGINIKYQISNIKYQIECFTTRPDTNFGATFIVIAPEHEFVKKILDGKITSPPVILSDPDVASGESKNLLKNIKKCVKASISKSEQERLAEGRKKTGVFTGFYAVNDLNGKLMPIWISDFVLASVGTGAVVGVPGHDLRDFEFAKEYGLEIVRVVVGKDGDTSAITKKEQVQEEEGRMINSGFLNGLDIHTATKKIMDYMEEKGWGKRVVTYHLHDWIFSRQRYWGEPIPMIYCKQCAKKEISYWDCVDKFNSQNPNYQNPNSKQILNSKNQNSKQFENWKLKIENSAQIAAGWFPVPEDQLPIKLPYVKSYQPTETGESPLAKIKSFVKTKCPHCGGPARRETDTMPNWAGSCWYYLYFAKQNKGNPKSEVLSSKQILNPKLKNSKQNSLEFENSKLFEIWNLEFSASIKQWLPVNWYLGGAEHAVLHLLYARFWVKALQDLGLLDFSEPFLRLRNVGMVLAEDHRKMSKSFGNIINPDDVVSEYGADTLRIYEMFMAPFSSEIAWSTKALAGAYRFLTRVWQIYHNSAKLTNDKNKEDKKLVAKLQKTILKVSSDITNVKFNTAIAAMMEFLNAWEETPTKEPPRLDTINNDRTSEVNGGKRRLSVDHAKQFLQILAPFASFITEQIWYEVFGEKQSIHLSSWPKIKGEIREEEVIIPIQVNGKLRATIKMLRPNLSETVVINKSLKEEKVKKYLTRRKYKVIYIEGKILNFVTREYVCLSQPGKIFDGGKNTT